MRNLRKHPIRVKFENETKIYDSIIEFCEEKDFKYSTVLNWLRKKAKPSIDIEVEYV